MEKRSLHNQLGAKSFVVALVAFLCLCLIGILTVVGENNAQAVDLGEKGSITMNMPDPAKPEFSNYKDMPTPVPDGLKFDLYKVASATKISGQDAFTFSKVGAFANTETSLTNPTSSDYIQMAQESLEILKNNPDTEVARKNIGVGNTASELATASGLEAGMYLVVVHGDSPAKISDYIVQRKITDSATEESKTNWVTIANSPTYEFSFMPQLISVPSRLYDGKNNTANRGNWQYDVVATLKPTWNPRYGSLEIVKDLLTYDNSGKPATFVFEVEGRIGNKVVYSNVIDITFDGATSNRAKLDGIQAGATVTVKEVYTGATYELTSAATQNATIKADDVVQVNFENDHNDSGNNGGSVSNRFGYTSGDTAADSQWNLKQIIDGKEQQ